MKNIFLFLCVIATTLLAQGRTEFPFISLNTTEADRFVEKNPQFNGDGVVVFVLDSGVDPGILGLSKLPDGGVKVIDTQDFSGQGDVYYSAAEKKNDEEGPFLSDGLINLRGFDKIDLKPTDSLYYMGSFNESEMQNSGISDVNNNISENDVFGILIFKTKIDTGVAWVAYVDTDMDGNIDDEKPVRDYKINFDTIHLRGRDPSYAQDLMTFTINIFPHGGRLNLHFADNAHGSHCAGIAAGYSINGQKGLNGVAPGARIISLKIGNNTLAGGATVTESMKKALNYASEYASAHPEYDYALNMSYGIGSEIEGQSAIDKFMNSFFTRNSQLTLCTSNGNEGPGLSTTGTPAAARRIMSVGAMMPEETARNTFGYHTTKNEIFYFSSRGGDSNKPDFVAPGVASSTVPYYRSRDTMWGTSMASPHAAGVVALLLSALRHTDQKAVVDNQLVKRAMKNTARPLPGYTWLDQGSGLLNVPASWDKLQDYYRNKSDYGDIVEYRISAPNSEFEEQKGETIFYRAGGYVPTGEKTVKVSPVLPKDWDADKKARFYQPYKLFTEGDLVEVREEEQYFKGKGSSQFHFTFNSPVKPGLYTANIYGVPKNLSRKRENAIFNIPVAVIKPDRFTPANGDLLNFKTNKLKAGEIQRFFVQVDEDVSVLRLESINAEAPDNNLRLYVFDQEGRTVRRLSINKEKTTNLIYPDADNRGTWEFVFWAEFKNRKTVQAQLKLNAYRVNITTMQNAALEYDAGNNPEGSARVVNSGGRILSAQWTGRITGYVSEKTHRTENETYQIPLKGEPFVSKIVIDLELLDDDFEKMTDFAVNIVDQLGRAVLQDGFTYKKLRLVFHPSEDEEYTLEFVAGLTQAYDGGWAVKIKETRYYTEPRELYVSPDSRSSLKLLPQHPMTIDFELNDPLPALPRGYFNLFQFEFVDERINERIPILFWQN